MLFGLIQSFIHATIQQVFIERYYVPRTVKGSRDRAVNKTYKKHCPAGAYILGGMQDVYLYSKWTLTAVVLAVLSPSSVVSCHLTGTMLCIVPDPK